jgi:hypothetical protein
VADTASAAPVFRPSQLNDDEPSELRGTFSRSGVWRSLRIPTRPFSWSGRISGSEGILCLHLRAPAKIGVRPAVIAVIAVIFYCTPFFPLMMVLIFRKACAREGGWKITAITAVTASERH